MSYSMYVSGVVDGEPAPNDKAAIRDILGPITLGGMPPTGLPESWNLEAEDGGVADVRGDADGLTFHRFSAGRVLDRVAELACRTGAVVIPLDCPAILTAEAHRKHLPENFRADAIVVPSAAPAASATPTASTASTPLTGQTIDRPDDRAAHLPAAGPTPTADPPAVPVPPDPEPVATGSVTASDEPCVCCGQERGWVYTGPVYAADAPDTGICPYCIAFGTAAEHYDAFFTDGIEGIEGIEGDGDVPQDVVTAVLRRTPGFAARQSPRWLTRWLTHCGDSAAFLGLAGAGAGELKAYPDAVDHLTSAGSAPSGSGRPPRSRTFSARSPRTTSRPRISSDLFRCRVCEAHPAYVDFT